MTSTPTDFQVLGIEPGALCILGKCSSTELLNPEKNCFKYLKINEQIDISLLKKQHWMPWDSATRNFQVLRENEVCVHLGGGWIFPDRHTQEMHVFTSNVQVWVYETLKYVQKVMCWGTSAVTPGSLSRQLVSLQLLVWTENTLTLLSWGP